MKNRLCLLALLGTFFGLAAAASPTVDYTGHYELAEANADRSFSLDITQTAAGANLSFSAAMADGSGAAPDGDGKGRVDASGARNFTFKDSFDNEGTGTLQARKDGYLLKMNVTRVVEPRPLRFYGSLLLKKTGNKPASSPERLSFLNKLGMTENFRACALSCLTFAPLVTFGFFMAS